MTGVAGAQAVGSGERRALEVLEERRSALGLTRSDVGEVEVTARVFDEDTRTTHVHLRQLVDGVPVPDGVMNISIDRHGRVLTVGDRFVENLAGRTGPDETLLTPAQGLQAAAGSVGLPAHRSVRMVRPPAGAARRTAFDAGWASSGPVEVALAWVRDGRALRLSWSTTLTAPAGQWQVAIDARTGEPLVRRRLGADSTDGARYLAFAPPLARPGERTEVVDPADPVASPHGWHDTDGVAGADTTTTDGINARVLVREAEPGTLVDGGPDRHFAPDLDLTGKPSDNRDAAAVNAFVWANHVHDVLFRHGFDEDAANFQRVNRSGAGKAADAMFVELRAVNGMAHIDVQAEGVPATMSLGVQAPAPRAHIELPAPIGVRIGTTSRSGPVGLTASGAPLVVSGTCDLGTDVAGAIAVLTRDCQSQALVTALEEGGAKAAILAPRGFPRPAGSTIPVVGIEPPEDTFLLDRLDEVPTLSVVTAAGVTHPRDYALANDVIVHEYGHGVSMRLVGGGANTGCQISAEPMGEGWSDFLGLVLTARGGQAADRLRAYGTWPLAEDPDGPGARRLPYSPDIKQSPLTYGDVWLAGPFNRPQPHFVGMRWAAALWQVYWELVERHGYNPDHRGHWTAGGNLRALRVVLDGMKLTRCSPGFVDGRNAVLLAEQNLTGGMDQCALWEGFAARGLGRNADQGSTADGHRSAFQDQTPDHEVPAVSCRKPEPDSAVARRGQVSVAAPGVRANDPAASADDRLELVDPPEHGTVELSDDGAFVYRSEDGYEGRDGFSYRLSDGLAVSPKAHVVIDVVEPKILTTTTLTASPSPSLIGEQVRFTAKVAPVTGTTMPPGEISFERNATTVCTSAVDPAGTATCDITFTAATRGTPEEIVARYQGDGVFAGSASTLAHSVNGQPTSTELTMAPQQPVAGQEVTYTARVVPDEAAGGIPSGQVSFRADDEILCDEAELSDGVATCRATHRASPDPLRVTASYGGDERFAPSASAVLHHVVDRAATQTTLTRSPESPVNGQRVTYRAAVEVVAPGAATLDGTVGFRDGDELVVGCDAVAVVDGAAQCTTTHRASDPPPAITARFQGTPDLHTSQSAVMTYTVARAASMVTVTQVPQRTRWGDRLVVSASVTAVGPGAGTPGGTVTFMGVDPDGEVPLGGPVTLTEGHATMAMPLLAPGARVVVRYSGGGDHERSSAALTPEFSFDRVVSGGSHLLLAASSGRWLIRGAKVGALSVTGGASVAVMDSTVRTLSFVGGTSLALCGSHLAGSVAVHGARGSMLIGGATGSAGRGCAPNRMFAWLSLGLLGSG